MPAHYAHTCFGQKVFELLKENVKEKLFEDKALFIIGLQGPDILFYHKPLSKGAIPNIGRALHRESGNAVFEGFLDLIRGDFIDRKKGAALKSYMAGFLCHYLLDSACHPFVDFSVLSAGIDHSEIEAEFDKHLMRKKGVNPFHRDPLAHLLNDEKTCKTISQFYPGTSPKIIEEALSSMRNLTKWTSGILTNIRPLTMGALRIFGKYDRYQGIVLKRKGNPRCLELNTSLEDLMEKEVKLAALLVEELLSSASLDSFLPKERFAADFSGNKIMQEKS